MGVIVFKGPLMYSNVVLSTEKIKPVLKFINTRIKFSAFAAAINAIRNEQAFEFRIYFFYLSANLCDNGSGLGAGLITEALMSDIH